MTKTLPVGISANTGRKKGYRLHRSVKGKEYNFGTIQNHELALRLNGYIDIIVNDLRESQAKEGFVSIDQVQQLLVENSVSDMEEITRLIADMDSNSYLNHIKTDIKRLENKLDAIVTVMQLESQKTLWQRITGR